jgi:hypothetical protein
MGSAQPIAVDPGNGKCTRTLGTNLYFVGDCDANGDLELRPRIGNQVLGIATVIVPTGGGTTNLVSTSAGLATGDVAIMEGYSAPGDGGGGQFWFEVGPMNRKIMAAVSSQVSVASTQPNSAGDLRVRVHCSSAHQLVEGQAVTVSGALDGGANGNFIITLAGLGAQATTDFILLGVLARGTFGAGGMVGTTVLTIPGHPYETGHRLVIRRMGRPDVDGPHRDDELARRLRQRDQADNSATRGAGLSLPLHHIRHDRIARTYLEYHDRQYDAWCRDRRVDLPRQIANIRRGHPRRSRKRSSEWDDD